MQTINSSNNRVFAGRELEMKQLFDLLENVVIGAPHVMLVRGEAGSGKTYLVEEFLNRAQQKYTNAVIAVGNCSRIGELSEPFLPFREILLSMAGLKKEVHQSKVLQFLSEVTPDWLAVIPMIGALIAAVYKTAVATKGVFFKSGTEKALYQQFENVLLKTSQKAQPLLLFLDDFHWTDESSAALLLYLIQRMQPLKKLSALSMLMLVAYRPDELESRQTKKGYSTIEVLNEIGRYGASVIELDRSVDVDREYLRQLVSDFLHKRYGEHRIGDDFCDWLIETTSGNCLMLDLLLSDLEQRGELEHKEFWQVNPSFDTLSVPNTLSPILNRKLQMLQSTPRAIDVLQAASVQGNQFSIEVLAHIIDTDFSEISIEVDPLIKLGFVVSRDDFPSIHRRFLQCTFRHDLLRQYIYDDLSAPRKRALHRKTALALEYLDFPVPSSQLAQHFFLGGIYGKAAEHYLIAMQQLLSIEAMKELEATVNQALLVADYFENQEEKIMYESKIFWYLSYIWDVKSDWQSAIEKLEGSCEKYQRLGFPTLAVPLTARVGGLYMRGGLNYAKAEEWLLRALESLKSSDDEVKELATASDLINVFRATGQLDRAIEMGKSYVARYEPCKDIDPPILFHIGILLYRLGWSYELRSCYNTSSQDFEHAIENYERSLAIGTNLGVELLRSRSLAMQAHLLAIKGQRELAQEQAQEAVDLIVEGYDARLKALILTKQGAVLVVVGKLKQALEKLEEALIIQRDINDKPGIVHASIFLADCRRRMGDTLGSQAACDEAWQLLVETKHFGLQGLMKALELKPSPETSGSNIFVYIDKVRIRKFR